MICMTKRSLVATPAIRRVELEYLSDGGIRVPSREFGTVYHGTIAQRKAERAFNRALAREREAGLLLG
jgi:hypothetical protein